MASSMRERPEVEVVPPDHVAVEHVPSPTERAVWWRDAQRWTRWLDSAIPIPGTGKRVGWDGIVGFVPVVGDVTGLALSAIVMPILARAKRRVARAMTSRALEAEATQTSLCAYLSVIALAGVAMNALLGWWWADPVAALAMVPIIAKEGIDGARGEAHGADDCC